MRCALLAVCVVLFFFFFFRRQPPCQILQRKGANESETARVPKQRGSENVRDSRHSLLCRALQCASIISNFSRSGMKNGRICWHTKAQQKAQLMAQFCSPGQDSFSTLSFICVAPRGRRRLSFLKRRSITGMLLSSEQRASRGPAGYLLKEHCAKEELHLSDTRTLSTNYAVHFALQRTHQLVAACGPNRRIKK